MKNSAETDIEQRVKSFYDLAKSHPEDTYLQEAASLVKYLRRSQGALQGWNGRYREENSQLSVEITKVTQTNETLELNLQNLRDELDGLNQKLFELSQEKKRNVSSKR